MQISVKKLHPDAKIPTFAHADDTGMDLFAVESVTLEPGEQKMASTGIAVALPQGYAALIWDKSSVATKKKVTTVAGVFDAGYRGEYLIALYNFGTETQTFAKGDKIAQVIFQKIEHPELVEQAELDDTERGVGGFGSTGSN